MLPMAGIMQTLGQSGTADVLQSDYLCLCFYHQTNATPMPGHSRFCLQLATVSVETHDWLMH